jgi:hypothetical protein
MSDDSTIATSTALLNDTSPHDDVPTDLFSSDNDSTCLVKPVVDCSFSTLATDPSPHDDVPADLFSTNDDSTCLALEPVVDCCFTPCNELSWFLGAMLIHWNDQLVAQDSW